MSASGQDGSTGAGELLDLARWVVERAEAGEEVEAFAVRSVETDIEVFDGEVDSLSSAETRGVGLRVIVAGRQGYASTAVVTDEGLAAALEEARTNAAVATPDEANALPEPSEPPELDGLEHPGVTATDAEDKIALALELEAATRAAAPEVRGVDVAAYGDVHREVAIASTRGLALTTARTDAWAYAIALASRDDETQTGLGLTLGRTPDELDVAAAGRESATRAVRLLGATKPKSRKVPVVLDPYATAMVLGVLSSALSAEAVLKGRSLFAGRVGERVAADLTLVDDGLRPGGLGTAPWDGEGVPQQRTPVIDGGTLTSYLHNTWTARRSGGAARSTGNASRSGFKSSPGVAPTNLFLEPGEAAPEALLEEVDEAVYVQEMVGLHSGANPISGEFSVGVSGLVVRDGELAEPFREATVASTIIEMLRAVERVGSDLRFYPLAGAVGGSTVLIGEMSVGGR